jgi:6-phosphogluconolactonase
MLTLFIGSMNRSGDKVRTDCGITLCRFDEDTLEASTVLVEAGIDNPSYLVVDGGSRRLYAVSEVESWLECTVSAYDIAADGRSLTYLNKQPTRGRHSCHVNILPDGSLGVANYSGGEGGPGQAFCVLPIAADGALEPPAASAAHKGPTGPRADRQERSHAHCVMPTLDGLAVLVTDLGLDCVVGYAAVAPWNEMFRLRLPAGSGPRHLACHPNGRIIYSINELQPTIAVLGWDGERLEYRGEVPALPASLSVGETAGAGIAVSPDGRFVYASIRGADVLSALAVSPDGETLELVESVACGGTWPRAFALTPSGRHMLVANQRSDEVAVLARDADTGRLRDTGVRVAVRAPQCVQMLGAEVL